MTITATTLSVVVNEQRLLFKKRVNKCTITMTSADTYALTSLGNTGFPLPAPSAFGMVRNVDHVQIIERWQPTVSERWETAWSATLAPTGTATNGSGHFVMFGLQNTGSQGGWNELLSTATIAADQKWVVEVTGW